MISLSAFKPLASLSSFAQAYSELAKALQVLLGFCLLYLSLQLSKKLQTITLLFVFIWTKIFCACRCGCSPDAGFSFP